MIAKTIISDHSLLTIAAIILLAAAPLFAQDAVVTAKVDELVKVEMQKSRVPGLSLAVVKDGKIVLAKGYGLANVELQVAVKPETIFQSGSVGKQFAATAAMMLVEDGKINLDEPIGKYLGAVPDSWKNIRVRHLLTHTSGLTELPFDNKFLRGDYTEDELLKLAQTIPVAFAPGEKWQYSNLGYVTLGILISKVTGKFYGDFLQERIFKPLDMKTARIINEADIIPNRAAGYRLVKNELKNQEWVSPTVNTTADGSLYLTTLDMAKWDAALYTEKLLKKTSLEQMWTPVKLNDGKTAPYGFGWGLRDANKRRVVEHDGEWQGFTSNITRYVDDKLTVIILDNLARYNPAKLAQNVAAIYNPELAAPPIQSIEDKNPQVAAQVKDLLDKLAAGTADPNLFTPGLQKLIFPDLAKELGANLKLFGAPTKILLAEVTYQGEIPIYRYHILFKETQYFLRLAFNKQGKIALFEWRDASV